MKTLFTAALLLGLGFSAMAITAPYPLSSQYLTCEYKEGTSAYSRHLEYQFYFASTGYIADNSADVLLRGALGPALLRDMCWAKGGQDWLATVNNGNLAIQGTLVCTDNSTKTFTLSFDAQAMTLSDGNAQDPVYNCRWE